MVRITTERDGSAWRVRVHGELRERDVPALEAACRSGSPLTVHLDLSELRGVDDRSAEALRAAVAKGARVRGASPYIELRLGREPNERPCNAPNSEEPIGHLKSSVRRRT
jgi:hypothetical protein